MITASDTPQNEFLQAPRVVGVATSRRDLLAAGRLAPGGLDALELRLDAFPEENDAEAAALAAGAGLPVILTLRHHSEGGLARIPNLRRARRAAAALRILDEALRAGSRARARPLFADIELRQLPAMGALAGAVRETGSGLVLSFHDFCGTPPSARLLALAKQARRAGADVVKIACTPNSARDLAALFGFAALWRNRAPLALMGMGPFGPESRLLFARLGSALNYGHLGAPSAPGQWPAAKLKAALSAC